MTNRKSKATLVLFAVIFAPMLLSLSAQAQIYPRREPSRKTEDGAERDEKKQEAGTTPSSFVAANQALEKAVEAETYLVGPGDVFLIQIIGPISEVHQTEVTPEGKLIIPNLGSFVVDQQTLATVQKQVQEAGQRFFNQTLVSADLLRMRAMRVHVVGQVLTPGSYIATPVDRITDMLSQAGDVTNWAATEAIEIRHRDDSVEYFNYSSYRINANLSTNIYVRSGDVIFVPPVDLSKPLAHLEADNISKGVYQIKAGENVENFLLRIGVLHSNIDFQHAILVRQQSDSSAQAYQVFPLAALLAEGRNGNTTAKLRHEDRIILASQNNNVYVRGAVQSPGAFPFLANFAIQDYIGLAGGTAGASSIKSSYVIRDDKKHKGKHVSLQPGDTIVVPESLRAQFRDYFATLSQIATLVIAVRALR
jgi:protein involved in polysaccharide export with SLBB domain